MEGLERCTANDNPAGPSAAAGPALALEVAQAWVGSAHGAFARTGFMYEKYHSDETGVGGGGGEYEPQVWFCGLKKSAVRQGNSHQQLVRALYEASPLFFRSRAVVYAHPSGRVRLVQRRGAFPSVQVWKPFENFHKRRAAAKQWSLDFIIETKERNEEARFLQFVVFLSLHSFKSYGTCQ